MRGCLGVCSVNPRTQPETVLSHRGADDLADARFGGLVEVVEIPRCRRKKAIWATGRLECRFFCDAQIHQFVVAQRDQCRRTR